MASSLFIDEVESSASAESDSEIFSDEDQQESDQLKIKAEPKSSDLGYSLSTSNTL